MPQVVPGRAAHVLPRTVSVGASTQPRSGPRAVRQPGSQRSHHLDGDLLERLPHRGQPGRATWAAAVESSKPDHARRRPRPAGRASASAREHAHRHGVAGAHERRSAARRVEQRVRGRGGRTSTVSSPRARQPAGGQAVLVHPVHPAARAGPRRCSEPFCQPIQAIRRWPRSTRWSTASTHPGAAVDVDPGVAARPGSSQGRPNATNGTPRSAQPGGLRVAAVGVGDHERVDRRGAQQLVVRRRLVRRRPSAVNSRTW